MKILLLITLVRALLITLVTNLFKIRRITNLFIITGIFLFPSLVFARTTPDDIYQARRAEFENSLNLLQDEIKKEKVRKADTLLNEINQKVSSRFEEDVSKLSAIIQEYRRRKGLEGEQTIVAFGQGRTQLEVAEYWINFAQEAIAYQKVQDYTPQISSESNLATSLISSMNELKNDLTVLKEKILRAKAEVKKAI